MTTARGIGRTGETYGPGRQLVSDIRLAGVLVNEARHRAFELIGVRRDDANIATFVVAGMLADIAQRRLSRLSQLMRMSKRPSSGDVVLAGGTVGELLHDLGGPSSREVPFYGALIVLAVAATRAGPVVVESIEGIASLSRATLDTLHRNYRYLMGRAQTVAQPDRRRGGS